MINDLVLLEAVDDFTATATRLRKRKVLLDLERGMARDLAGVWKDQGAFMVRGLATLRSQFQEAPAPWSWTSIVDRILAKFRTPTIKTLMKWLSQALSSGAGEIEKQLGISLSFDLGNPQATQWMRTHGADLVKGLEKTTHEAMQGILGNAVEQGKSWQTTARTIRDTFDDFGSSRAQLVARTEMAYAYEEGLAEQADRVASVGVPMEKRWLSVDDGKVDEVCAANEGQDWIGMDDPFDSGDDEPPAHPACRCTTEYRVAVE